MFLFLVPQWVLAETQNSPYFLVISDIHLNTLIHHRMNLSPSFTNPLNDLDRESFDTFIAKLQDQLNSSRMPQPKFMLLLGDLCGHHRLSKTNCASDQSYVFHALKSAFPQLPIFYTFGNNDALGQNYGPFIDQIHATTQSPYLIARSRGTWVSGFLSNGQICQSPSIVNPPAEVLPQIYPCLHHESRIHGYYSAYLESKLKLITLNSVIFSPKFTDKNEKASKEQLNWLEQELTASEKNDEAVLLNMHIPPGGNIYNGEAFWRQDAQDAFLNLVERFHLCIIGILSGHTHQEEIKIILSTEHKIFGGIYQTAALSTLYRNAPALKIFQYTQKNKHWLLLNYQTYVFKKHENDVFIDKLYDFNQYYNADGKTSMEKTLSQISAKNLARYYHAGNPKIRPRLNHPEKLFIQKN